MIKKSLALLVTFLIAVCLFAGVNIVSAKSENLISGVTYTTSFTDDKFHASYPDADGTKLTDGAKGTSWGQATSVGVYTKGNSTFSLDFKLDSKITFKQINLGFLGNAAGITMPSSVKVYVKNDTNSEWTEIFSGAVSSSDQKHEFVISFDSAVSAKALRFTISNYSSWVFMDEIEVFGELTEANTISNLALNKSYETIPYRQYDLYPDTDFKEMTDGIHGTDFYLDPAWNGMNYKYFENDDPSRRDEYRSFIIDLEGIKTITSVEATFYSHIAYAILQPRFIETYASIDGQTWLKLSSNTSADPRIDGIYEYGWHVADTAGENKDETGGLSMVAARYVRVVFELAGLNFIDEVEVYGYDGVKAGAVYANYGRSYDFGSEYMTCEQANGIHDLMLCYNGWYGKYYADGTVVGDWDKEDYKPILTYIDRDGNSVDTMYDAVLFLALNAESGVGHGYGTSWKMSHIEWWLDKMFKEGGDVYNLNEAALQVREDLDMPDYKVGMVMSFPQVWGLDHENAPADFGTLDGRALNLQVEDDYYFFMQWFVDEIQRLLAEANYEGIEFKGYYWTHEGTGSAYPVSEEIQRISEMVHAVSDDCYFYWIPYGTADGTFHARENGFDVWSIQPNYFFTESLETMPLTTRLCDTIAKTASLLNASMEFEFDGRLASNVNYYNRFVDYLNSAVANDMTGRDIYRSWYHGGPLKDIADSKNPDVRHIYEQMYAVINGTAEGNIPYIDSFATTVQMPEITTDLNFRKSVNLGTKLTLTFEAEGNGTLTYQWFKDGVKIEGATDKTFTIDNVTLEDQGDYYAVVTNTLGEFSEANTTLACEVVVMEVAAAPTIITNLPTALSAMETEMLELTVEVEGNGNLTYNWYKDNALLKSTTENTLVIDSLTSSDAGEYYVAVVNKLNGTTKMVYSNTCVLTVSKYVELIPWEFDKTEISVGEEFVMTFKMPEKVLASSLGLKVLFDNTAFEITNIAEAPYTDMQPYLPGCNNAGNVMVSYCDPTYDANTTITKGTVLLEVTFKVKDDAELGEKVFEIEDWNVTGPFNEETYEMDFITPAIDSYTKSVEVVEKPGVNLSGSVKAFGDASANVTIELVSEGTVVATTTVAGNSGTYTFEGVEAGSYVIKVSKTRHALREYAVEVVDTDVTQDLLIWLYGDVTGDGVVNNTDVMQINRYNTNNTSVFNQTANSDYRFKVANVTAITGTDTVVNNTDVMQINRYNTNNTSVFDRLA